MQKTAQEPVAGVSSSGSPHPQRVGDIALTALDHLASERSAFAASFQCPDTSGKTAPCDGARYDDRPVVPFGENRRMVCPVFQEIQCDVWKAIEERKRAWAREEWIKAGRVRGIPLRYTDATFETSSPTPAVEEMRTYLERDARRGQWLILLGPPGTSKTWASACAVRQWPRDARLIQVDRLVGELMNWDRRAGAIEEAARVSLLALDDYGRGHLKPDGFAELGLEELLAERHAQMRPTTITSNWTPAMLKKRLSERLIDRIRECAKVVVLTGPSLRG